MTTPKNRNGLLSQTITVKSGAWLVVTFLAGLGGISTIHAEWVVPKLMDRVDERIDEKIDAHVGNGIHKGAASVDYLEKRLGAHARVQEVQYEAVIDRLHRIETKLDNMENR